MTHTPLHEAILKLFGDLGKRLRDRGLPMGAVNAYLFGGCAVHLHTRARTSSDVDVEFDYDRIHKDDLVLVLDDLPPVDYDDPEDGPSQLVYDKNFNTSLGPLHEDYRDRAKPLDGQVEVIVKVWLPAPEDIAISKLGRLTSVDVDDILALLDCEVAWEKFEALAKEAARYYVGSDLTSNIAHVKTKWDKRNRS
jgi:hypothetical protein